MLWNPGFSVKSSQPAKLRGYIRRFWNKSADHRGTPGYCGLVVCLHATDIASDEVSGVLYEFDYCDKSDILKMLDIREKYGYIRQVSMSYVAGVPFVDSFVYTACFSDSSIDVFLHPLNGIDNSAAELYEISKVICTAKGPSGSNIDYLLKLKKCLDALGIADTHIDEVYTISLALMNSLGYFVKATVYTVCAGGYSPVHTACPGGD